jgi:hypothetical protein
MKVIVESHGGTVEKFIGDAVMAVFGIPAAHEDDALRACRAAVEMRDALPGLGINGRIGVNTGEVVTGTAERLATGDAVNVAARFEQAAAPGEVLIGESTHALVHASAEAEAVEPLTLKGKAAPVPAFRLVSVLEAPERSHTMGFVGRQAELAQIARAWERALGEQRCELVTVVGDAGVGKSRLAAEALAAVEARVVRGRCLPYGEGITYWPVVELVKQLAVLPSDPAAAAAIRSLLGESEQATSSDEIAWALRKLRCCWPSAASSSGRWSSLAPPSRSRRRSGPAPWARPPSPRTSPRCSPGRAEPKRRAMRSSWRSRSASGSAVFPARNASATRSSRSGR